MPKKRKVQPALPVIEEEAKLANNDLKGLNCDDVVMKVGDQNDDGLAQAIIEDYKEQVAAKAEAFIAAARQQVQSLRADGEAAISRLSKKVRSTSALDFFGLTSTEAAANILHDVLPRLHELQQKSTDQGAVDAVAMVAAIITAMAAEAEPVMKGVAEAGSSLPSEQNLHQETAHVPIQQMDEHEPSPEQQQQQQQQQQELHGTTCVQASAGSAGKLARTAKVAPPPPPRQPLAATNAPARLPGTNEELYSANGSPIHIGRLVPPGTLAKGTAPLLLGMTPAAAVTSATVAHPATLAFTSRRAGPTRGRVKQPTRSITVTTHDGKQFTVDDLIGMAAVPQAYREEVEAELKDLNALMQSVAALEQDTANPSSTTASALRPVRRR